MPRLVSGTARRLAAPATVARGPVGVGGPVAGVAAAAAGAAVGAPLPLQGADASSRYARIYAPRWGSSLLTAEQLPAPASLHYMMLADAGRVEGLSAYALDDGEQVADEHAAAIAVVRRLREVVKYSGFKASAATVLFGDDADGMPNADSEQYIGLVQPMVDDLETAVRIALRAATRSPAFKRCVIRIDVVYTTEEGADAGSGADRDFFVPALTATGDDAGLYVPYVFRGQRAIIGTPAQLRGVVTACVRGLRTHIDAMPNSSKSDRVFGRLVGAHVWATPTNARQLGAGIGGGARRGLVYLPSTDGRCIARALVAALDPYIDARTDVNLYQLRLDAAHGARKDVEAAWERAVRLGDDASTERRIAVHAAVATAEVAATHAEAALRTAARLFAASHRTVFRDGDDRSVAKTQTRASHIARALGAAVEGRHPLVDLQDVFFSAPRPIDDETVAFIRSKVKPHIHIQFWGEGAGGAVALNYPSPTRLTYDLLEAGAVVVNLLCEEDHVSAITDVAALCAPVTATNQRGTCCLCGSSISASGPLSPLCTLSRLAAHRAGGCPAHLQVLMTLPLSPRNVRQLPLYDARARWPTALFGVLADCGGGGRGGATGVVAAFVAHGPAGWRGVVPCTSAGRGLERGILTASVRDGSTRERAYTPLALEGPRAAVGVPYASTPALPVVSDAAVEDILRSILSGASVDWLAEHARLSLPCIHSLAEDKRREDMGDGTQACFVCKQFVFGPSRWAVQARMSAEMAPGSSEPVIAVDSDDEEDGTAAAASVAFADVDFELHAVTGSGSEATFAHCPTTGRPEWVHRECGIALKRRATARDVVTVLVTSHTLMAAVSRVLCGQTFREDVLGGGLPTAARGREGVRAVQVSVPTPSAGGRLAFRFKAPHAMNVPELPELLTVAAVPDLVQGVVKWATDSYERAGLWPLYFDSDIAFSRAALYDSLPATAPPLTSLTSADALASYNRMARGGRVLTGCAVVHPPLVHPTSRRVYRAHFDVTAMYPSIMLKWPLPHQEHTDTDVRDYSDDLAAGVAALLAVNVADSADRVFRVELWGAFPPETHDRLAQFPPLFERRTIAPDMLTPFQRARLDVRAPEERSVCHLWPLTGAVVFVREAQLLLRLGFVPTRVGRLSGCVGSFWARGFARMLQKWRRSAACAGDAIGVAAAKQTANALIGSMNMNVASHTVLKAVRSEDIDHGTLEVEYTSGQTTRGDKRARTYHQRLADSPKFTGRVWECGAATFVEMGQGAYFHTQMTAAALAVQAYARCAHAELWYGDGTPAHPGIVTAFPDAKVLYGNTDSLIVEIALTDSEIDTGAWHDARAKLFHHLSWMLDISNVPAVSSFRSALEAELGNLETAELFKPGGAVEQHAGEWGRVKEETGWAGYEAVVVNGPNRWGARVVQSAWDTLPKHRGACADVLKSLPRAWIGGATTLEQYAASWTGADASEEGGMGVAAAPTSGTRKVPPGGTCVWGNISARVYESGVQLPFGYEGRLTGV